MIGGLVFLDQHELPDLEAGEAVRVLPLCDCLWFVGPIEELESGPVVEERSRFGDHAVDVRATPESFWSANLYYGGVGVEIPAIAVPEPPLPEDHPVNQREAGQEGLERWSV